jgi:hypothetical protein
MNKLKSGPITQDELLKGLVNAKKLMSVVDSGDFERGNIDESQLLSDEQIDSIYNADESPIEEPKTKFKMVGNTIDEGRLRESKLPDNIKNAMRDTPIPQIMLNDTIDMDFVKSAQRMIQKENNPRSQSKPQRSQSTQPSTNNVNTTDLISALTPIIESTIRKVLDEKLTQLLSAQKMGSINENLVLKVGDSIFRGKITGVGKSK